jgi:hypothetical protein
MLFRVFLLIPFLFADVTIHAQTAPAKAVKPTATVWTRGSVDSARKMFAPGAPVKILGRKEQEERDRDAGFVPPRERNALFRKVGIELKVAKMDEFDKDMLVMSAREYNLRELKSDYPMFTDGQLRRLKEELRKMK